MKKSSFNLLSIEKKQWTVSRTYTNRYDIEKTISILVNNHIENKEDLDYEKELSN